MGRQGQRAIVVRCETAGYALAMDGDGHALGLVVNPRAAAREAAVAGPFTADGFAAAHGAVCAFPGYGATPLRALSGLGDALGVDEIHYKDEAGRFGLGSFKPLGAPYAAARALLDIARRTEPAASLEGVVRGAFADALSGVTLLSATDGNHGRAVAYAAKAFGARAKIFAHPGMSEGRRAAIRALGAALEICPGGYDDSVRAAYAEGAATGNPVIQDTTMGDDTAAPFAITEGYGVIAQEVFDALDRPPTHAIVQAGVGGVASAICARFWQFWGAERPKFIVLEPHNAACVAASLAAGRPVTIDGNTDTAMAGLACGTVSSLAWDVLATGADAALLVPDAMAATGMKRLARPLAGDPAIVGGECAGGAIGALMALAERPDLRAALEMGADARVFVLGTEGATDPALYERLVGIAPESVAP
ncbi:MAG: diaminopropionate ammonia-lyase [Pseudomonadota bacterium]